jgi:type I restriction enzyme S subunit
MGIPHVSGEVLRTLYITFPNKEEQSKIAQYLDNQTTIIDQLILQKEKLIELLKEKRQAVINEAVTKGLNPNAKMKDSGIAWLGSIPQAWNLVQIRHLNTKVGSGVTPKGGAEVYTEKGVIFIRSQNVHFDGLHLDDVVRIDLDTHKKMSGSKVQFKDVLLNITGASIGRCCVVDINEEMNVNQHVCIIRPTQRILSEYLNLVLQSNIGQVQIKLGTTGGNREGLTFEAIKEFTIPLPGIDEQHVILDEVLSSLKRYYELENFNTIQIDKLKEYRQSIISEAVTGKIDVRDWKPNKNQVS